MNIILLGMKHCGKTTVGALLAEASGLPFYDLDDRVIMEAMRNGGKADGIEDVFRSHGQDAFFRMEKDAFESIRALTPSSGFVLALGGRTPFNPLLFGVLEQCGVLVYINTPFTVIRRRIFDGGTSVLLNDIDPEKSIRSLYDERHPVYLRRARLVVDGSGTPEEIVARIRVGLSEETADGR